MEKIKIEKCRECGEEVVGRIKKEMCEKCYGEEYRENNREKINAACKKYREDNPERVKDACKKYYKKNLEKERARSKKYYKENKDKLKKDRKKYYIDNPEKIKDAGKKYYEKNKMKIRKKYREDYKKNIEKYKKYGENKKKNICIICGEPAYIKFCSEKCMGIGIGGKNSYNWQGGKSNNPYPKNWKKIAKEIRARDNNRCMRCGKGREEFKHVLSVHHIDADKLNINPNNLISLCDHVKGSCHSLTRGKEKIYAKGFRSMLRRCHGYKYGGFV